MRESRQGPDRVLVLRVGKGGKELEKKKKTRARTVQRTGGTVKGGRDKKEGVPQSANCPKERREKGTGDRKEFHGTRIRQDGKQIGYTPRLT